MSVAQIVKQAAASVGISEHDIADAKVTIKRGPRPLINIVGPPWRVIVIGLEQNEMK